MCFVKISNAIVYFPLVLKQVLYYSRLMFLYVLFLCSVIYLIILANIFTIPSILCL
ncbi:hypothetical protein BDF20DRAFT_871265 [Mycotypha africana]|uniref:uncharacterized protein n=1 Tax=Mycotypha africana TaxID=64632 RepID=UPI00230192F4|nr:uncharacterized protein BDF20DRAFT_871265 [Mycotypha africana]KAI8979723.1 hypothetical protein BDF20DRAFT_871265 [Mycotypha africana]